MGRTLVGTSCARFPLPASPGGPHLSRQGPPVGTSGGGPFRLAHPWASRVLTAGPLRHAWSCGRCRGPASWMSWAARHARAITCPPLRPGSQADHQPPARPSPAPALPGSSQQDRKRECTYFFPPHQDLGLQARSCCQAALSPAPLHPGPSCPPPEAPAVASQNSCR